jgi:carboxylesterase type B
MSDFTSNSRLTLASVQAGRLNIKGSLSPLGVAKYLGVTYATFPERFRQAKLQLLETESGTLDATNYGPRCPQPADVLRGERSHLYEGVQPSSNIPTSEYECLKLNIYTLPQLSNKKLPVLVWIHGGGWTHGDGNSEFGKGESIDVIRCLTLQMEVTLSTNQSFWGNLLFSCL